MEQFTHKNRTYRIDFAGFLVNPSEWDENFAEGMAAQVKIPGGLTEKHWDVIRFIRTYHREFGRVPLIYETCRENKLRFNEFKKLFPAGYQRGACKLAGLTYREGFFFYSELPSPAEGISLSDSERTYTVDVRGFLVDPSTWDKQFAIFKAHEMKMARGLSEKHWQIIDYLRERYQKNKVVPTVYDTCDDNDLTIEELEELFPNGYHRGAVKLAGLRLR